jgi:hypothetical protein
MLNWGNALCMRHLIPESYRIEDVCLWLQLLDIDSQLVPFRQTVASDASRKSFKHWGYRRTLYCMNFYIIYIASLERSLFEAIESVRIIDRGAHQY